MNPFAKVLLCTTSLLAAIVVLPSAIFASVDPTTVYARAFALLAAEPYVETRISRARGLLGRRPRFG